MRNKSGNTFIQVSKSDLMVLGYYRSETGHGPFIRRRLPVYQISSQYAGLTCTNIAELPSNDSNIVGNIKIIEFSQFVVFLLAKVLIDR